METSIKVFTYPSTCAGDPIQPVFKRKYDKDMKREIVKQDGEVNLYEMIQEADNSSDLVLMKKAIAGDTSLAPEDASAIFSDGSLYPNNIHELYGAQSEFGTQYDKLPESVKKIFPDVSSFRAAIIDGSYADKVTNGLQAQAMAAAKAAEEAAAKAAKEKEGN